MLEHAGTGYHGEGRFHLCESSTMSALYTEILMREQWEKCHKIPLTDEFNLLVLPNSTKEPTKKVKLPVVTSSYKKKKGRTGGNPAYGNPEKAVVEVPSIPGGEHVVSTLTKNSEID